ncbi:MAG: flavin reductase family protein [Bdellovibrionota bacterium]
MKHETFAKALGKITSGLYLMTSKVEDDASPRDQMMLASWVQQVSFEPPMLVVAVNHQRSVRDHIHTDSYFGLNIIGQQHSELMKAPFQIKDLQAPFGELQIHHSSNGVVKIAKASAFLECKVQSIVSTGDHDLVIAEVTDGEVLQGDEPMAHVRKNGLSY